MPTIDEFTGKFTIGARANLFKVTIPELGDKVEFLCKAASLPGKTINPIEVKYLNNTIKVAGDATFEDWTVTILNDEDNAIRKKVIDWMEKIKANAETKGDPNSSYFKDAEVQGIKRDGSPNGDAYFKFKNLWPSAMDAVELSFDTSDTIQEFGVTFSYSHWEKA